MQTQSSGSVPVPASTETGPGRIKISHSQRNNTPETLLSSSFDINSYARSLSFLGNQLATPRDGFRHRPAPPSEEASSEEDELEVTNDADREVSAQDLSYAQSVSFSLASSQSQLYNERQQQKQRRKSSRYARRVSGSTEVSSLLLPKRSANQLLPPVFPYGTAEGQTSELGRSWTRDSESDRRSDSVNFDHLSSFSQTLFNCSNVLLGVGILALPVAFAHAGWFAGTLVLLYCGIITNYTAKILAKILRDHPQLYSYADIGSFAFGQSTRTIISTLFCLELFALSVALVVLFGDSLSALIPSLTSNQCKIIGFFVITPTIFLPLRLLSYTSLIGIFSILGLLITVFVDGIVKKEAPGSLRHPAPTSFSPDWKALPLCFGLMMSSFAGHSVMPSICRDMQNPQQFNSMINTAYVVCGIVYTTLGAAGYAMFGNSVSDEITQSLLSTPGYPKALTIAAMFAIALNPVCKFALSTRPLHSTVEYILGLDRAPLSDEGALDVAEYNKDADATTENSTAGSPLRNRTADDGRSLISFKNSSPKTQASVQITVRLAVTVLVCIVAIVFPGFENVMSVTASARKPPTYAYRSFLGAFSAFVICVLGPMSANLAIYGRKSMSTLRFCFEVVVLVISVVMCVTGTVFSFLPK